MGTPKTLYGATRTVPATGETGWGSDGSNFCDDLIDGVQGTTALKGSVVVPYSLQKTPETLAASATLTPTHPEQLVSGSGGAVTLSVTNAIADGSQVGEVFKIKGTSASNTVTIPDGANTKLNGAAIIGLNTYLTVEWDGSDWCEVARNN